MQSPEPENNHELNNNWDEASLAQLLGFNDGNNPTDKTEASNPIATDELFDDPELGKTQPTFYGNPLAKFGAVGLVMLVVFGAGATVLNSIMSGKPKIAPTIAYQETDKPQVEIADNANPQETETGKLKAELALGSQAEKIKSLERSQSPKTSIIQRNNHELNKQNPPRIADTEVHQAQVSYVRRPLPQISRYDSPPVASVPRFQPVVNRLNTPTPPQQKSSDAMEEWAKISRLGSYGSAEIASVSKTNSEPNGNTVNTTASTIIPHATLVSTVSEASIKLEPLYTEEAAIINGEPIQQLQVGASASGKLITPLIWSKGLINNSSKKLPTTTAGEKFVIQLIEPLTTKNGLIFIPKGSQIIAQVTDIQKSGLVQIEASQIVINGQEYLLPPGAISIRGNSNQPLIASKWGDKGGEIASRDAEAFVVGSLAKVGKVLNQPKSQQISTSIGLGSTNTFSSISGGSDNILGAVLEGGFEPLTQQILQRNQQALSEIQQREEVWYIRAGTNIQVFVNQSFQL